MRVSSARSSSCFRPCPTPSLRRVHSYSKKKIDERIRTLLENGVKERHRSFFVVVGDRGRDCRMDCDDRTISVAG